MDLGWVPSTVHDVLPQGAVQAGSDSDGSLIFVGRAFFQGDHLPCKIIPNKQAAYVSYDGSEHFVGNYEVLCGQGYEWVPSSGGEIPVGAFEAGQCKSGETLFIGRAEFQASVTPGKVHRSHKCLYIPYGGSEHSIQSYEVLVVTNAPTEEKCCCCCCIQ